MHINVLREDSGVVSACSLWTRSDAKQIIIVVNEWMRLLLVFLTTKIRPFKISENVILLSGSLNYCQNVLEFSINMV